MDKNINSSIDTIDFAKLKAIFLKNSIWILLLFSACNLAAYLFLRYTKDIYEAHSEIKLEIKNEANEFGITKIVEDQNLNLISGEIELIQSNLFLSRVIDSLQLHVSYYSIGEFLDYELYKTSPFYVKVLSTATGYTNKEHILEPVDGSTFKVVFSDGKIVSGTYGRLIEFETFRAIIGKTEDGFDSKNTYSFVINDQNSLYRYFSERLRVEPKNLNANIIRISFKEFNPLKATDIVNKIVTIYQAFSNEQKNFANKHKIDWVNNELSQIELKMEEFENYFKNFTITNRTQNLSADIVRVIQEINQIDTLRYELNRKLRALENIEYNLKSKNDNTHPALSERQVLPPDLIEEVTLFQKKTIELNNLKLSYKDQTFAYKEQEYQLTFVRDKLIGQITELKTTWSDLLKTLTQKKKYLENEFLSMPDKDTEFTKKQRYYNLYEEFYFTLMKSRSEFEIAQAGTIPDFKVLSTASVPSKPISPNRAMVFGIGFSSGVVVIFFFVGLLYVTDNKITSVYELERIAKIPILGIIPAFKNSKKDGFPIVNHPRSMVSESIRTLRTNLEFFKVSAPQKIIAISSTVSGEGKSFVARNIAGVIAQSNKKVILLDLDMRKPKDDQPPPFNNRDVGMSSILVRKNTWQECVHPTPIKNFDILPAGPHPPNPSELLVNGELEPLLSELKTVYDYIIIDTPPVGIVTDGIMVMKRSDICIYLFRANYSKKEFLYNLKRINTLHSFSNVTAILNALPSTAQSYGYGYYHEEKKSRYFTSIFSKE